MSQQRARLNGWLLGLVLVAGVISCESPSTRQRLAQLTTISAEKDSLVATMAENTRFLSEISSELAKVRDVKKPMSAVVSPESPLAVSVGLRDSILAKIKDLVVRVNQAESRLAVSQRRLKNMGGLSDSLKSQLALMEQALNDTRATIENQKATIASMTEEITGLKQTNAQLTERTAALTDTVSRLDAATNTVYYVIGTKDDLKAKGVVVEEGAKFLIFGGKSLMPARELSPAAFTAIDRRKAAEIVLPEGDRSYRIVSRQNLQFLQPSAAADGQVKGSLHITEPERFWAPSPYLIIIQG